MNEIAYKERRKKYRTDEERERKKEGMKGFPPLIVAYFNTLSGKVLSVAYIIKITRVLVGVV